jgi:hypothetical protein
MVISKLKPLSSEFYTHFHEKNRACLRQFNAIPNAIYNIFRLVEGDQATSTKVQKWLSGVYDELSGNVNTSKSRLTKMSPDCLWMIHHSKGLTMVNLKFAGTTQ